MVSKISGNKPSAIQAPKTEAPKAPPKTEQAAATAKGWGAAGAAKAGKVGPAQNSGTSQVKLLSAKIEELPGSEALVPPKGYAAMLGEDKRSASMPLADGRTAKFEWDSATLSVKGPNGKTVELVAKDEAGFKGYQSDFNDNFKDLKKEDLEFTQPDWDSSRSYSGVGAAGKMMSVSENVGDYMGGAHPNHGSTLQTYDASTGQKVTLDQLVSKEQFQSIVATIAGTLPKLKGGAEAEGVAGETFSPYQDMAKHVAENFALTTDTKGNAQITVAWESGVHALGPLAASFTFAAPTDAAFKAKIGLE